MENEAKKGGSGEGCKRSKERNKKLTSRERAEGLLQSESTLQRLHFSNQAIVSTQGKLDFSVWKDNAMCICGE